jgi:hypothetical protein
MKRIFLACAVLLALTIMVVASGITSVPQILLFLLITAFFVVLVKGAFAGPPPPEERMDRTE